MTERRAIEPDIEKGIYPFKDIKLTRADVEWLLATHKSSGYTGPVDWSDERQRVRDGLDVRGADLKGTDLRELPLASVRAGLSRAERGLTLQETITTHEERHAAAAQLQGSGFFRAHLEGAHLARVHLEECSLELARLECADLAGAYLQGSSLRQTHIEGAYLRHVHFDAFATLSGAHLTSHEFGPVSLVLQRRLLRQPGAGGGSWPAGGCRTAQMRAHRPS